MCGRKPYYRGMSVTPLQALQAAARPSSVSGAGAPGPRLLVAGAGGLLGSEVLQRLIGRPDRAVVQVLACERLQTGLRGVQPLIVPTPGAPGGDDFGVWPRASAEIGVVMFEPPRNFLGRERALWTPTPAQLPALARWMRGSGVRTLAVVLPHARGRLPEALKQGLASLDEHALAAMDFERLLIVRSAQLPVAEAAGLGLLPRLAAWMLDIFKYMVPPAEQPLRAAKLAELVELALRIAPPGLHVLPPELLWRAARGPAEAVLRAWFARAAEAGEPRDKSVA